MDIKSNHEAFVSGNDGVTPFQVITIILLPIIILQCQQLLGYKGASYFIELVCFVFPVVLSLTFFAKVIEDWFVIVLFGISILLVLNWKNYKVKKNEHNKLGLFRGMNMLLTLICILAVDFQVFPRTMGKTETFGTSLMDLFVGFFIVSSAIVKPFKSNISFSVTRFLVLFLLGVLRLLTVKNLEYHEHVTEYGVHWNFFFTLSFVMAADFVLAQFSLPPLLAGFCIALIYELCLFQGVAEYIFSDYRTGLVSKNKEGILGLIGYVGLSQISIYIGGFYKDFHITQVLKLVLSLILAFCVSNYFIESSRRLVNLSYVLFCLLCSNLMIVTSYVLDLSDSHILKALNRNQLAVFLLGNVLTGAINMNFDTIEVETMKSLTIIMVYIFIVTVFANSLQQKFL